MLVCIVVKQSRTIIGIIGAGKSFNGFTSCYCQRFSLLDPSIKEYLALYHAFIQNAIMINKLFRGVG